MTVFENVAFGLKIKPKELRPSDKEIHQKVNDLLKLVQLDWLGDRFPAQLSGGQRQRIALARALAVEPKVLLLDEPFGALDAKVRQDLRRWLRRLHDELHITSIFVTHDQQEALEVADHIVLMQQGKVVQMGSPHSLYQKPQNAFVYEFLGGTNTFEGKVEGEYIRIGEYLIPHYQTNLVYGQDIKGLSRPHEIDIITDIKNYHYGILANIKRIHYMGGLIQIELIETKTQKIFYCETHIHSEQIQKEFHIDMQVRINPSSLHVF
jgi:sulfate transport system ATP-binding protein